MTPPEPHAFGRFLTLADVGEVLNVSASQAYALVRSGELPAIKVGGNGHWRIERVGSDHLEVGATQERSGRVWTVPFASVTAVRSS